MVRFPYILDMWYEEDATTDPETGMPIEGAHEWIQVSRCNARQNGKAIEMKGADGKAFLYSYEIVMPPQVEPIPLGTKVRVVRNDGINIFSNKPISESDQPGTGVYEVQGFYKSGQKHEDTKLWV